MIVKNQPNVYYTWYFINDMDTVKKSLHRNKNSHMALFTAPFWASCFFSTFPAGTCSPASTFEALSPFFFSFWFFFFLFLFPLWNKNFKNNFKFLKYLLAYDMFTMPSALVRIKENVTFLVHHLAQQPWPSVFCCYLAHHHLSPSSPFQVLLL